MSNNSYISENDTTTEKPKESSSVHSIGLWIGIITIITVILLICGYVIFRRVKRKILIKNIKNTGKNTKEKNGNKNNSISTKLKSFTNDNIQNNIKVEDLNSFKKKSDSNKENNKKDLVGKIIENKEDSSNKNLSHSSLKSEYQSREKKSCNTKINENIDVIAEMKNQLENIKKVKPLSNNNRRNRSNSSSNKNERKLKENVRKLMKNLSNNEKNKKEIIKKSSDVKDIKSNRQNCENNNEIFYSCSSDIIGMTPSTSSFHSSSALNDKDLEKLNKINVTTNNCSLKKSKNFEKDIVNSSNSTFLNTSNKHNVKKNKDKVYNNINEIIKNKENSEIKRNKKSDNFNKNKNSKIEETGYTVTEPEDIIEYNVSRDVLSKENETKNINLINNGTYINQSFINLSSDYTQSQNLKSNKIRKSIIPTIKSNVPKISNIYIYPQYNCSESFIRKGKNSPWVKQNVTPSYFDYEVEKCNNKKLQERFEIIDETSKTEDEYNIERFK